MAKMTRKEKAKEKKHREWKKTDQSVQDMQSKAGIWIPALREVGCDLPFYDYMDSYITEFATIVAEAKERYPSLIDVLEVSEDVFNEKDRRSLVPESLKQVFFDIDASDADYYGSVKKANIRGATVAYLDANEGLHTLVIIPEFVKGFGHKEFKYAVKVAALCHEIGHVHDIERGINFDVKEKRANIIEAEIFANLFAFDWLAERQHIQTYGTLKSAMEDISKMDGMYGTVGKKVLDQLPEHKLIRWQDFLNDELAVLLARRGVQF